jgi:hypothetical protein
MLLTRRSTRFAAIVAATTLSAGAVAAPAAYAQTRQDGLVNVVVGDITIAEDVNIAAAVGIAAQVCDAVDVTNVTLLANRTDQTSRSSTVCRQEDGDKVRFVQN